MGGSALKERERDKDLKYRIEFIYKLDKVI